MAELLDHLFVYGTLRPGSGHPMADFLAARGLYIGPATTPGCLYDLGSFPGMKQANSPSDRVYGDLYRLRDPHATLAELDKYEACTADASPYFVRQQALVTRTDGGTLQAWVYVYCRDVGAGQRIWSGDYLVGERRDDKD